MKHFYFLFLLITSLGFAQLTPPPELQAYYSGVDFTETNPTLLYDDLAAETIAKHTNILSYSQRHNYLYDADEDLNNAANVILVYSGESRSDDEWLSGSNPNMPQTFNTEHVYPQSLIGSTARADLHHLRSCDVSINSSRGNKPFASDAGPSYADLGSAWYPGDEWKGDVARMIMYLNLRYNEPFSDVGTLSLFLQWNAEDPVSIDETQLNFEDNRNTVISGVQGNRNPFIDNPYIATVLWGGPPAQNRWAALSVDDENLNNVKIFPNPIKDNTLYFKSDSALDIELFDVLGKQVHKGTVNATRNFIDVSALRKGVYILRIESDQGTLTKKLVRQ